MKNSNLKTYFICFAVLVFTVMLSYSLYKASYNVKNEKIETISFGWQSIFH